MPTTIRISTRVAIAIAVVAMTFATVMASAPAAGAGQMGPGTNGYYLLGADGGIFPFNMAMAGSAAGGVGLCAPTTAEPNGTCTSMAVTPSGQGYWILNDTTGVIYPFGTAGFYSDPAIFYSHVAPDLTPTKFIQIVSTPSGKGYWVYQTIAGVGQVAAYGDAKWFSDTFQRYPWGTNHPPLNAHPVGLTATPDGNGYWEVWSDGGVFSFGDAKFYGSTGAMHLVKPIIGMTATADGKGYWLLASDGGVFSFGDARFGGSTGGLSLVAPVTGMTRNPNGPGYWLAAADGGVFAFGGAPFIGSIAQFGIRPNSPIVAIAARNETIG